MPHTHLAIHAFNKHAKSYQERFMDQQLYHESFDVFCSGIPQHAKALDVACGPGNITKYLLTKRPDLRILGIDLASNMLDLARQNNPGAEFQLMDAREISRLEQKFHGIMCGFCLPYLSGAEAEQLIRDASALLESSGVLYISTMEADPSSSGFETGSAGDQVYMNYHLAEAICHALEKNNFFVLDLQRKRYPGRDGKEVTDLLIIAKRLEL